VEIGPAIAAGAYNRGSGARSLAPEKWKELHVKRRRRGRGRIALALRRNRVVAPMRRAVAARALFFDVRDFASTSDVAITADDASAGQRRKAEQSNHAHIRSLTSVPR
jgi:hypothetical protein